MSAPQRYTSPQGFTAASTVAAPWPCHLLVQRNSSGSGETVSDVARRCEAAQQHLAAAQPVNHLIRVLHVVQAAELQQQVERGCKRLLLGFHLCCRRCRLCCTCSSWRCRLPAALLAGASSRQLPAKAVVLAACSLQGAPALAQQLQCLLGGPLAVGSICRSRTTCGSESRGQVTELHVRNSWPGGRHGPVNS